MGVCPLPSVRDAAVGSVEGAVESDRPAMGNAEQRAWGCPRGQGMWPDLLMPFPRPTGPFHRVACLNSRPGSG